MTQVYTPRCVVSVKAGEDLKVGDALCVDPFGDAMKCPSTEKPFSRCPHDAEKGDIISITIEPDDPLEIPPQPIEAKTQYAYSLDWEHYNGEYDTVEEAAAAGFADPECEKHCPVSVGEIVRPTDEMLIPSIVDVFDSMREQACDIGGDFGDDYMFDCHIEYNKNRLAIEKEYAAAVLAICDRYGIDTTPTFFKIQNEVTVDNPDQPTDESPKA